MTSNLTIQDHSRDVAGLKYVYPVLSRRAGGLSIGVNLNTNNACNWRCIYCQVPGLVKGAAPEIDLDLLATELRFFLDLVISGQFYQQFQVEESQRVIKDIAISGNGEPTSAKDFERITKLIGEIATEKKLLPKIRLVLITNGSLVHQEKVQLGLKQWHKFGGEVWFKLDSATEAGRKRLNNTAITDARVLNNIITCSKMCVTKIQTCLLNDNTKGLTKVEQQAFIRLMREVKAKANVKEVMLYTLARPSYQPEAREINALPLNIMNAFAECIRELGFKVSVSL